MISDSFEINIAIDKSDSILKVGYRVDVTLEVYKQDDQIVVPKKSVLTDVQGNYVFIKDENIAKKVYVTKGFINNGYVQVFDDIKIGDELIVKGQNYISEGSKVAIEGEENEKNS